METIEIKTGPSLIAEVCRYLSPALAADLTREHRMLRADNAQVAELERLLDASRTEVERLAGENKDLAQARYAQQLKADRLESERDEVRERNAVICRENSLVMIDMKEALKEIDELKNQLEELQQERDELAAKLREETEKPEAIKPPLGYQPEKFWLQARVGDLIGALERVVKPEPGAWTDFDRCAQIMEEMFRHVERMTGLQAADRKAWEAMTRRPEE